MTEKQANSVITLLQLLHWKAFFAYRMHISLMIAIPITAL